MLDNKGRDAAKYLCCCSLLEEEAFNLYRIIARKMKHPEVDSLLVGIAYDSLKHSKILREIVKNIIRPEYSVGDCKKNIAELWQEVHSCSEEISKIKEIDADNFCAILKELVNLEDALSECYSDLLKSKVQQSIANELSKLKPADLEILENVFENIIKDKQNHREILIEIVYFFAAKKTERTIDTTPMVKYQNPNGWNRQPNM